MRLGPTSPASAKSGRQARPSPVTCRSMPTCSSISSTFPAARPISTAVTAGYSFQESSRLPMRSHPRATGSATEDFCFKTKGGNGRSTADSTERFCQEVVQSQRGQFQSNPITAGNRADLRPNLEEAMPEESRIHKGVSGALRGEAKEQGRIIVKGRC